MRVCVWLCGLCVCERDFAAYVCVCVRLCGLCVCERLCGLCEKEKDFVANVCVYEALWPMCVCGLCETPLHNEKRPGTKKKRDAQCNLIDMPDALYTSVSLSHSATHYRHSEEYFGVASISRFLKITGLFCKRAL